MPLVRSTNHSPLAPPDGRHAALWSTGFRSFYLGGAGFGAIAMLAWLGALAGHDSAGRAAPRAACSGTRTKWCSASAARSCPASC